MSSEAVNVEGGDEVTRTFLSFLNAFSSEEGDGGGDAGMAGDGGEGGSPYRDYVEQLVGPLNLSCPPPATTEVIPLDTSKALKLSRTVNEWPRRRMRRLCTVQTLVTSVRVHLEPTVKGVVYGPGRGRACTTATARRCSWTSSTSWSSTTPWRTRRWRQGLTLVHFLAQRKHILWDELGA